MAFLLILGSVKNRQVNHLVVQGQSKSGDLSGIQIKFFQLRIFF